MEFKVRRSEATVSSTMNREIGTDRPVLESPHKAQEDYVRLAKSVLVRVNIRRSNGNITPIVCLCHEVNRRGLSLVLPASLGLSQGDSLQMEVFTLHRTTPVPVKAVVRKVSRSGCADTLHYSAEVRFRALTAAAERAIRTSILCEELHQRHRMPI